MTDGNKGSSVPIFFVSTSVFKSLSFRLVLLREPLHAQRKNANYKIRLLTIFIVCNIFF